MSHEPSTTNPTDELYERVIRRLPAPEQVRLATRILTDLDPNCVVDYSTEWTEEDMHDFMLASMRYFDEQYGDDESYP